MSGTKRTALYLRVSTVDKSQTTENQRLALTALAAQRRWTITETYEDAGISGAKGRDKRPGLDKMLKDATRGKFDVVMVWSTDRLGRSLQDLLAFLQELHAANVDLLLHQQAIDTTTPAGKAMFGMMGVFAEFERTMIQARVAAGMARAKTSGTKSGRSIGRPGLTARQQTAIRAALASGMGIRAAARHCKVSTSSVNKVAKATAAS